LFGVRIHEELKVNEKVGLYSFGVVLLELTIAGREHGTGHSLADG
jgi:hypothetical protein